MSRAARILQDWKEFFQEFQEVLAASELPGPRADGSLADLHALCTQYGSSFPGNPRLAHKLRGLAEPLRQLTTQLTDEIGIGPGTLCCEVQGRALSSGPEVGEDQTTEHLSDASTSPTSTELAVVAYEASPSWSRLIDRVVQSQARRKAFIESDPRDALQRAAMLSKHRRVLFITSLGGWYADGLALLKEARAYPLDLPTVVLTAADQVGSFCEAARLGLEDFIFKDRHAEQNLARVIRRWVRPRPVRARLRPDALVLEGVEVPLSPQAVDLLKIMPTRWRPLREVSFEPGSVSDILYDIRRQIHSVTSLAGRPVYPRLQVLDRRETGAKGVEVRLVAELCEDAESPRASPEILVVEDSFAWSDRIQSRLRDLGLPHHRVADVESALNWAHRRTDTFILCLDLSIPLAPGHLEQLNGGFELLARLPTVPTVILSDHGQVAIRSEASRRGVVVDDFVDKQEEHWEQHLLGALWRLHRQAIQGARPTRPSSFQPISIHWRTSGELEINHTNHRFRGLQWSLLRSLLQTPYHPVRVSELMQTLYGEVAEYDAIPSRLEQLASKVRRKLAGPDRSLGRSLLSSCVDPDGELAFSLNAWVTHDECDRR